MRDSQKIIWYGLQQIRYGSLCRFEKPVKVGVLKPFGFNEQEIGEILEEETEHRKLAESLEYRQMSKPERERIFLEDGSVSLGEAHEARRKYLENELKEKASRYFGLNSDGNYQRMLKAQRDYNFHLAANKKEITPDMILRAKEYPITDFIRASRFFALCPFHNEKTPSFYIKKNFGYCFGCNWTGDVISFVMKIRNIGFVEAVKLLS